MKEEQIINKPNGIEIIIMAEKNVYDEEINSDGWILGTKRVLYSNTKITLKKDNKEIASAGSISSFYPYMEKQEWAKKLISTGAVSHLTTSIGFSQETTDEINTAMRECVKAVSTEETEKIESADREKEKKIKKADEKAEIEYRQAIKNGFCTKCGTYCHGDCEANK